MRDDEKAYAKALEMTNQPMKRDSLQPMANPPPLN